MMSKQCMWIEEAEAGEGGGVPGDRMGQDASLRRGPAEGVNFENLREKHPRVGNSKCEGLWQE